MTAVLALSPAEEKLVAHINHHWTRERALFELRGHLQIAIEVELATLPVYLFTYYSIDRTPKAKAFPETEISRFADQAGASILSVAVEEMLHMSLSSNILFALGVEPQLYGRSPGPFPTNLPGHQKLGPDGKPVQIALAKFSSANLWKFLEIEYPAHVDATPEGDNWATIGQIYSYLRCVIASDHIHDADFKGDRRHQIQPGNYSPNSIDTAYPAAAFIKPNPVPAGVEGSAAGVVRFPSTADSHAGRHQLLSVSSKKEAIQAISTICDQGEGFGHSRYDDSSKRELSHYEKFLALQAQLVGYPGDEPLPRSPEPPPPAKRQFTPDEVRGIVFDFPSNPVAAGYPAGRRAVADLVSGLYQYMLIMTETIFRQPPEEQKRYFNQSLHRSMIWILDKLIRSMRLVQLDAVSDGPGGGPCLAPTFENINLGPRDQAFATLGTMCADLDARYGNESWYTADLKGYVDMIPTLPDVSALWAAPTAPDTAGRKYAGVPKFPSKPPSAVGEGEVRHACMGLNHCAGQGRTRENACAGQGYCSTALKYDFAKPAQPLVSDHTCHVLNACRGQGGCGLYGTAEEQDLPGHNECATLGSCATPINAERFSTDGGNHGKSVWKKARAVFQHKVWPSLHAKDPRLPTAMPDVPGSASHPDLFAYGPTIEWITDYSGAGMTACGSSGMSGAGNCS